MLVPSIKRTYSVPVQNILCPPVHLRTIYNFVNDTLFIRGNVTLPILSPFLNPLICQFPFLHHVFLLLLFLVQHVSQFTYLKKILFFL